ncbi:BspA family leucine-rich repeat surface protein [Bifidobacterium sp. ESL0732]|uniref:BspA family leucine-rich repeat surface protein n=1 Tax=Bifidobacterium sp. ESL0732 TaxID=2983222 RepID=UPI0023F74F3E|nr:BspA family leucine-rich repeat surface protein [Bifidobacterium sp. ESL0732]WEV64076.1 BspA family leucine-rich repeat surface protein [Bifidobacterium sp. ESL0732]
MALRRGVLMMLRRGGITSKIAVLFTALALLSANAPAPETGVADVQSSTPQSSISENLTAQQTSESEQSSKNTSKQPKAIPPASGTTPVAVDASKPDSKESSAKGTSTKNTVRPQDGTCTQPGEHPWETLTWSETSISDGCRLTLISGSVPNHAGSDANTGVPWTSHNITSVYVNSGVKLSSGSSGLYLFGNIPNLTTVDVTHLDVTDAQNFCNMFWNDPNLIKIDGLNTWNMSNATNISFMFRDCTSLSALNLTSWDTSNVTYINYIFDGCTNLKTIGNPGLDVPETTDPQTNMYTGSGLVCSKAGRHHWSKNGNTLNWQETPNEALTECTLTLTSGIAPKNSGTDTNTGVPWTSDNVITATVNSGVKLAPGQSGTYLFGNLPALTTADVSHLDVTDTDNVSNMFWKDPNLIRIDGLENWDTRNIINISYMFWDSSNLPTLNLTNWNTSRVIYIDHIFDGCTKLKTIGNPGLDIPENIPQADMYTGSGLVCPKAGQHHWTENGNTLNWQEAPDDELTQCALTFTSGVAPDHAGTPETPGWPWSGDVRVTSAEVKEGVKLAPTGGRLLVSTLPDLKTADVSKLTTTGSTDLFGMFYLNPKLERIDGLRTFDTTRVTNMIGVFNTTNLASIDLSTWDTSKATDVGSLFANDTSLTTLNLNGWDTRKVTEMGNMFFNDTSLITLDLNGWDTSRVSSMNGMLPPNLKALRLGKKTILKNAINNAAFGHVAQSGTWIDKSGSHNPPNSLNPSWSGSTAQLAARAATDNPIGEYVVGSYTFPTACTQPGTHTWGTLTWSETLEGEDENTECVLTLESGTVPENSAGNTTTTGVPWSDDSVTKATVKPGVKLAPNTGETTYAGGAFLFGRLPKVKTIDVTNLSTAGNTSMFGMFWEDPALTTITGLQNFDTSKVTNMNGTFNVTNLVNLDISSWDTHNVTDMGNIFANNLNLTALDLNGWDTRKVTEMGNMFFNDTSLITLDLNGWDTSRVSSMNGMLPPNLKALRLGKKTKLINGAFTNVVQAGTWVDKSGSHGPAWSLDPAWSGSTAQLATRAATDNPIGEYVVGSYTFPTACTQPGTHTWGTLTWSETLSGEGANAECTLSLDRGTVPNNSAGTTRVTGVPWSDDSVTKATVKPGVKLAPNTGETTYAGGAFLFGRLPKVKTIDVTNLSTAGNTSMFGMFWEDPALTTITGLKNFDTSKVTNMNGTFNVTNLVSLDVSGWDTHNVTDMQWLFGHNPITTLDLNNWDTSNVTSMYGMLPINLNALRLGKKTKLANDTGNKAFSDVTQTGTWIDKSGSHGPAWSLDPAWSGSTAQLATRAATDNPIGEYVVGSYTFPTTCTQPGTHTWGTLTWSETLTGEGTANAECTLSLDRGTVPNHPAGTTRVTGVPWADDSVTTATVQPGVNLAPNTGETTYAGGRFLFGRLPKVKTIDVTNLSTAGNTDMYGMFWEDPALTSITGLKGFDTSKVTNMGGAFNVTNLASLDVSGWDTHNVTDMQWLFGHNPTLNTLDLNNWDTSKAGGSMDGMMPINLKALRLGKKTTLTNTTGNKAFSDVTETGRWVDKSGLTNPAWRGSTSDLASRAASTKPAGAYVVDGFNFTFPTPLSALPFTGLTRQQILRGLLIAAGAVLALALAAAARRARNRQATRR